MTYKPKEKKPIVDWLRMQGRFKHLFTPEENNEVLDAIQQEVDARWERILALCGEQV